MLHRKLKVSITTLSFLALCQMGHTADLSIGDPDSKEGELKLSGFLRAKYEDKGWSKNDQKLTFDAAKFNLDYQSSLMFGHIEYRCYQFDKLCDFSALVDGYVGYKINPSNKITVGLQPMPFGPGRFWESNNYGGIVTQVGLEDVHNVGINYNTTLFKNTDIDLGFFPTDGGNYHGKSVDSARYSSNFVEPDPSSEIQTYLQEKNMWAARVNHKFKLNDPDFTASLGGSYWYADVKNKTNNETGDHQAWALFSQLGYQNFQVTVTGGHHKIDNKDPIFPNVSVAGSFDYYNYLANEGDFYTVDMSYAFKDVGKIGTITPYAMYSAYDKKGSYKTSTRNIIGVSLDHKSLGFTAEYIMGKNDLLIGGNEYSLAQGNIGDKTQHLLKLTAAYRF
ncbi:hypothetical protein [Acinetobacter ihumii]|uniref:hypothetical protein n=1 Tax=Acinetobacter ihumii TaxID=2483802 RepID=UPI001030B485|nr:hypothetical protein [Acinetobacter ihumii]